MDSKILLAGIGGQGVLFAHQLLADCAIAQGFDVTGAETHGMSQRGGAVVSHLKIIARSRRFDESGTFSLVNGETARGDAAAPLIRQGTADFLLAFDAAEAYRNLPYIRRAGTIIVNCDLPNYPEARVAAQLAALNVALRVIDADAIVRALGRASVANVALIGFAATTAGFPFTREALRETIARVAAARFAEVNLKAFDAGVSADNW